MKSLNLLFLGLSLFASELSALPQLEPGTALTDATDGDDFAYDGRIVGGYPANIKDFPYQGSLQFKNSHICGCALIDTNLVITAAHCVEHSAVPENYKVRFGSSQQRYGGQLLSVKRIVKHAAYSSTTMESDIALILLSTGVKLSETVKPITLAKAKDAVPANSRLLITGWGLSAEGGTVSSGLQYVAVALVDQQTCIQNYRYIASVTESMFCAGKSGKDSCQGDSGGPLAGRSPNAEDGVLLYGIVSWGVGCARPNYPGVYVKVSAFEKWIRETAVALKSISYLLG